MYLIQIFQTTGSVHNKISLVPNKSQQNRTYLRKTFIAALICIKNKNCFLSISKTYLTLGLMEIHREKMQFGKLQFQSVEKHFKLNQKRKTAQNWN